MIPVFYINLAHRTDRRLFMEKQFQQLGIAAERIEAVTVDDLSNAQREAAAASIWGQSLVNMACSLSHQRTWQKLAERQYPAAAIFEDDAVIDAGIAGFLAQDILDRTGMSLLHLETWGRPARLGSAAVTVSGSFQVRRLLTTQPGTAAYIMSRPVALAAATDPEAPLMEADRYLFGRGGRWLTGTSVGQAVPAPCIQLDRLANAPATAAATSTISADRRRITAELPPDAERAKRRHNLAYSLAVMRHLAADPRALLTGRIRVPFAGDREKL